MSFKKDILSFKAIPFYEAPKNENIPHAPSPSEGGVRPGRRVGVDKKSIFVIILMVNLKAWEAGKEIRFGPSHYSELRKLLAWMSFSRINRCR